MSGSIQRIPAESGGALSSDVTVIGNTAYTTVIPVDADGDLIEGITAQSEAVIDALVTDLGKVGAGLSDIAHLTIYLCDIANTREAFNEVYARRFGDVVPVRCAVGVAALARPTMLVELTAVAAVPAS